MGGDHNCHLIICNFYFPAIIKKEGKEENGTEARAREHERTRGHEKKLKSCTKNIKGVQGQIREKAL